MNRLFTSMRPVGLGRFAFQVFRTFKKITIMKRLSFLLLLVTLTSALAEAAVRGNGKIAFVSKRDGNPEIYVMNPDGTGQKRITSNNDVDSYPVWSPDGKKIAFSKDIPQPGTEYFDLYLMNADGSDAKYLRSAGWPFSGVSWSPDGRRWAFMDDSYAYDFPMIYGANADGSNFHLISPFFECCAASPPTWAPDGLKIAYVRDYPTTLIYTVGADGSDHRVLIAAGVCGSDFTLPKWSPNGNKLLFSALNNSQPTLMVANSDGAECKRLKGFNSNITSLDWSPDGQKIVLSTDDEIFSMNSDGSGLALLADKGSFPSWQPVRRTPYDFDGDGKSDISVFRPSDRTWYLNRSTEGFTSAQFGIPSDRIRARRLRRRREDGYRRLPRRHMVADQQLRSDYRGGSVRRCERYPGSG